MSLQLRQNLGDPLLRARTNFYMTASVNLLAAEVIVHQQPVSSLNPRQRLHISAEMSMYLTMRNAKLLASWFSPRALSTSPQRYLSVHTPPL